MQEPFPLLDRLVLKSCGCFTSTDTFLGGSAPHLRVLHLDVCGRRSNPFKLPLIISSASCLVDLRLERVCNEHIPPKALVAALSTMVRLKYFYLQSRYFISTFDSTTPPSSIGFMVTLPLLHLTFHGPCKYLEGLLSGITTPSLESLRVQFLRPTGFSFNISKLSQFLSRIESKNLPCRAEMGYGASFYLSFTRSVGLLGGKSKRSEWLRLELPFQSNFNFTMSLMTQICQQISPFLTDVQTLSLPMWNGSWRNDECDRHWVDFLHLFNHVEELHLYGNSTTTFPVSDSLELMLANDVLPVMRELSLNPDSRLSKKSWVAIISFIDARNLVGLPTITP